MFLREGCGAARVTRREKQVLTGIHTLIDTSHRTKLRPCIRPILSTRDSNPHLSLGSQSAIAHTQLVSHPTRPSSASQSCKASQHPSRSPAPRAARPTLPDPARSGPESRFVATLRTLCTCWCTGRGGYFSGRFGAFVGRVARRGG